MTSLPWISIPTVALFFAEVRGYSKLYDNIADCPLGESASGNAVRWMSHWLWKCEVVTQCVCVCVRSLSGWAGIFVSVVSFLFFTDMCIYWIHRFLHHKLIYKVSSSSQAPPPSPPIHA